MPVLNVASSFKLSFHKVGDLQQEIRSWILLSPYIVELWKEVDELTAEYWLNVIAAWKAMKKKNRINEHSAQNFTPAVTSSFVRCPTKHDEKSIYYKVNQYIADFSPLTKWYIQHLLLGTHFLKYHTTVYVCHALF